MQHGQINDIDRILASRRALPHGATPYAKAAEEGGCGVTGFMASIPVSGRHIYTPSVQMHNRGNGKGGGIAAVGLAAADLGVSQDVLDTHYLLQVALLDATCAPEVEKEFVEPNLEVAQAGFIPHIDDYRELEDLEVRPPDVKRYFVRVKPTALDEFIEKNGLQHLDPRKAEDEYIYQNTFKINRKFYASLGEQRAFVLSHGRNIMILKIVGYAEKVAQYYKLDEVRAHGWIAHQRYPTKGRVWHPGGAHPFAGLDEALVHNGDFANYYAVTEYLKQQNIYPQFLTDTEVSALLFDLYNRTYGYPLEYLIEAIAPTSEYDFDLMPEEKQRIYRHIQMTHIHASPDGPWFFIIARNNPYEDYLQLIGITDTSMLRPQVFALQDGEVQIGLVCSEKQAIDATLESLNAEDPRFGKVADKYWNCRGGSASDGGAFIFTVKNDEHGVKRLTCTNKFGEPVVVNGNLNAVAPAKTKPGKPQGSPGDMKAACKLGLAGWTLDELGDFGDSLAALAGTGDEGRTAAIDVLTYLNDARLPLGRKKRSDVLNAVREALDRIFDAVPVLEGKTTGHYARLDWDTRANLRAPADPDSVLVIDAAGFPPEGDDNDARLICAAYALGWKNFIGYGYRGQRFCGCGLSNDSQGVKIDVYGASGDYLGSGIDGLEIVVHNNAQDQVGQITKSGKLVIHGDVGQTFMYGAKGGEVYVLGNAAGRPLINAVGKPRVVINGTCLDYLAESFMAGNPLRGGGFVVLNGVEFDDEANVVSLPTPYPGSNLFSLASGGAIYLRDPRRKIVDDQLNGGIIAKLSAKDWELILPYLRENERLFGISVEDDLLTVDGARKTPEEVYVKVRPPRSAAKGAEEADEEW
jgi:glutamate synthase domain-containing protein 1/glutamate synthase domain-containing protein 3